MKALRIVFRLGLLTALAVEFPGLPATAQTTAAKEAQPPTSGLRKLTSDEAKRAEELDKATEAALKADHWDEAIAKAEELLDASKEDVCLIDAGEHSRLKHKTCICYKPARQAALQDLDRLRDSQ